MIPRLALGAFPAAASAPGGRLAAAAPGKAARGRRRDDDCRARGRGRARALSGGRLTAFCPPTKNRPGSHPSPLASAA